jgi:hypothetical protein
VRHVARVDFLSVGSSSVNVCPAYPIE